MTRRGARLLGLGVLAAGCVLVACTTVPEAALPSKTPSQTPSPLPSLAPSQTSTPPTASPSMPGSPSPSPSDTPLPEPQRWQPSERDSDPQAKALAARILVSAATWGLGEEASAPRRLRDEPVDRRAMRALTRAGLDRGGAQAVAGVRYAQFGGLLPESASVMVVLEQWTSGTADPQVRTVDVRLRRGDETDSGTRPSWVVADVLPAQPEAALPPAQRSSTARAVLADARLDLPADARADVAAGAVDDQLLRLLLALGERHALDITVLRSGHPYLIFDKPRVSDHSLGRAADVWAIDGQAVIDQPPERIERFIREAAALGAYQIGAPFDPGPPSAPYYTDAVHQDHIHLGIAP